MIEKKRNLGYDYRQWNVKEKIILNTKIGINPINKITGINILFAFNVFLFPFVFKIIFSLTFHCL